MLAFTTKTDHLYSETHHDKNPNLYNGEILDVQDPKSHGKKMYIESYGCQMNFSDSEIVASILEKAGYATTRELKEADLVLVNTCSIREKAEQTVRNRLEQFNGIKKKQSQFKSRSIGLYGGATKIKIPRRRENC